LTLTYLTYLLICFTAQQINQRAMLSLYVAATEVEKAK